METNEPIINQPIPHQARAIITVEPFRLYGHYYLLMIDYYPKFITIQTLKNPKSSNVINEFKNIFSQFETLKELVTNNGPKLFQTVFENLGL